MTAARQRLALDIFVEATGLPEADRVAFVARVCASDTALEAEVLSLFEHDRKASGFLEHSHDAPDFPFPGPATVLSAAEASSAEPKVPETIGSYRIISRLGAGGMGIVYRAEQHSPRRVVAIKVIRSGIASGTLLRRFQLEAEILGRLHHPGISQIFEAGMFDEGEGPQPFLVMELIEGCNVLDFVRSRDLGWRERLDLFARICDVVQYAHQRSVIHRDLKPSNILVGSDGQPKVLDFGIARLTDHDAALRTLLTSGEQIVGTLQYMSPEQFDNASSNIDFRSDVYSLGVIGYEILCGRPPFDVSGLSIAAAARRIQEAEPQRPSAIQRRFRGDVDAILLKTIAKDRAQRYVSAGDLARDVRRHLAGDPIEARPPTALALALRVVRRHPVLKTAAACVVVGAVALGIVALIVNFLAFEPSHVVVSEQGMQATLASRMNHAIKTWRAAYERGVYLAQLVDRPAALGGGRFVALAMAMEAGLPPNDVRLYDVERPDEVSWTTDRIPLSAPAGAPPHPEDTFVVWRVLLDDFLPDQPGLEMLVVHRQGVHSQCAIRIYDLAGDRRFEVWHDGCVGPLYWLREERRLLLSAALADHHWEARGESGIPYEYPVVVFGLDVRDGHVASDRFINDVDGRIHDDTVRFYEWLGPPSELRKLGETLLVTFFQAPGGKWADGRHAQFGIELMDRAGQVIRRARMHFILDALGRDVFRWASDPYKLDATLPPIESFSFLPYAKLPRPAKSHISR